jgi:hypothetical protein
MSATLAKPVDARKAKPGDEVTARTDKDARASDGTTIKRGSKLVGHVTQAQPKASGKETASGSSESSLGFVFDRAVLKDGREVPLNATLQAVSAAQTDSAHMEDVTGGMSAAASGAGRTRGGGLVGGVAGSATGAIGATGGVGRGVGGTASTAVGGAGSLATRSAGAVGGVNAAGDLASGSRGVFGFKDFNLTSATNNSAEGSLLSSSSRDVRLDGGTKMLLSSSARATDSTSKSGSNAAGSAVSQLNRGAASTERPNAADTDHK